jgi:hypothetical protein
MLRELGIDNDTLVRELGFKGRATAKESKGAKRGENEPCPLETKGLTKV